MRETHADSVITGYKSEINPSIMFSSDDSSSATFLLQKVQQVESKTLRTTMCEAETYTFSVHQIFTGDRLWKSVHFLELEKDQCVTIDTIEDFNRALSMDF